MRCVEKQDLLVAYFKIAFKKAEINPAYFCIDTQTYYYNRISYMYILKRLLQQRKVTM